MISDNRVIYSDNNTLIDFSIKLNKFSSGEHTMPFVSAEDYLYIASPFPFNHRYIEISTANDQAASLSVDLWDGDDWKPAIDIIDTTDVGGVSLAQSGHVSWVLDKDESWSREDTVDNGEFVIGLQNVTIYDMYWARLKWSANLNAATSLNFVGHKFADDDDLGELYPELTLSSTKTQFEAGKTTWNAQHVKAAEKIIRDLKRSGVVVAKEQIFDWEVLKDAAIHKVAEVIFNAFGDDFKDNREQARKYYKSAMNVEYFNVDKNMSGRLDVSERVTPQGTMSR